jgi:hypothetical protein
MLKGCRSGGGQKAMKTQLKVLGGFALGGLVGIIAGCQTYNFEPVSPLAIAQTTQDKTVIAKQLKPNVMIVVDKSGSMTKPVDPNNPNCATGNPNCPYCGIACPGITPCPNTCPTRMSDLQTAMAAFLSPGGGFIGDAGPIARLGFTQLPKVGGGVCDPSALGDIVVNIGDAGWSSTDEDDATLIATASTVSTDISALTPGGGTPTAATLQALASGGANGSAYLPLVDPARESFVLLLTDGEPNCDANNPNDCTQPTCNCTNYQGVAPTSPCPGSGCACGQGPAGTGFCTLGCIDTDAVVTAITALRQLKIRTIPVGFGLETLADSGVGSGFAPAALNAEAIAGGFGRECAIDSDCQTPGLPTDTCNTAAGKQCADGTAFCCTRAYYVALNASQLEQALAAISDSIAVTNPCTYQLLATPSNASLVLVIINGTDIAATDTQGNVNWVYTAPSPTNPIPTVTFQGQYCNLLSNATPLTPVQLEFRIVQSL